MKVCRHCGSAEPDDMYRCSVCQRALPLQMPSDLAMRKAGLTVLVPALVWIVMTRLFQA